MKFRIFLILFGAIFQLHAQMVSTLAGSSAGNLDGTGAFAKFNNPVAVAMDASNNIYVADRNNHTIRKVTPAGVVTTLAGSSFGYIDATGTAAKFNGPNALAVNQSTGDVYVADTDNHCIRKITPAGVVTTFAGGVQGNVDGTGTAARFSFPYGIAVESSTGNVYVSDLGNNKIRKITSAGVVTTFAGGFSGYLDGTGTAARFNQPRGIIVSEWVGNIYVADTGNNRIRKITSSGVVSTVAGSGNAGNADGTGIAASFSYPIGVAVDYNENIFVADAGNHRIRKITNNGIVTTLAGSSSGYNDAQSTLAQFNFPYGIAINPAAATNYDYYVADASNQKIRKVVNTPPIIVAPNISNINPSPLTNTANINYVLNANNANTTSVVKYGTASNALVNQATGFTANGGLDTSGTTTLNGLANNKLYYFQIVATNSAGTTSSTIGTFTTGITNAIAEYRFDNSYANIYNTNPFASNSGTSFTADRNGNPNSALNINNTGTTATIANLPYGNSARTISFWAKVNTLQASYNMTFSYGQSAPSSSFGGSYNASVIEFFGYANNLSIPSTQNAGEWYFFTYVYDGTNAKIYKNGALLTTVAKSWATVNVNNTFKLGIGVGGELLFNGAIDDLKIFNYALNDSQIQGLYQNNFFLSASENNSIAKSNVSIYPNPTKDVVFVKSEKQITKIELYDFSGKKIKESASKEMNTSSLQRGNYLVKITDKEGNTQTKNLIKE